MERSGNSPEKLLVDQVLRRLRHGRVALTFWDGTERYYDHGGPEVEVALTSAAPIRRVLLNVGLATGEAYMDGTLVIPEDQLAAWFEIVYRNIPSWRARQPWRRERNVRRRRPDQIARHYDIGNDYYRLFLGETLLYTCAYFEREDDGLDTAQRQKVDLVLRKLRLRPGQRLLDIGSGWGYLSVRAAKEHGVRVHGVTLSAEQLASARALAEREGVADLVTFELTDALDLAGRQRFDRVVAVGVLEHIGRRNYDRFFRKVRDLLVDDGMAVLHCITSQVDRRPDPWVDKYIFPGGHLPTVPLVEQQFIDNGLWSIDRENLWHHYARTVALWRDLHRGHRDRIVEM
ncbi:MAG TPA: cyclopropane-fatty-acyl-phospholipid synthase family protein, partial [Acidimicrobiales bacterium]